MARGNRIMFKFKGEMNADGTPAEFHSGIPARDILESDLDGLTDEQKVTLGASAIYSARNDADEIAAKAEKRIEKAAPTDVTSQSMAPDTLIVQSAPAPAKDGERKA